MAESILTGLQLERPPKAAFVGAVSLAFMTCLLLQLEAHKLSRQALHLYCLGFWLKCITTWRMVASPITLTLHYTFHILPVNWWNEGCLPQ